MMMMMARIIRGNLLFVRNYSQSQSQSQSGFKGTFINSANHLVIQNPRLFIDSVVEQCRFGFSDVDVPLSIFHQLITLPRPPTIIVFTQLFTAMSKIQPNPPFDTVVALSNRLELSGIRPTPYSIAILAKCYCGLGRVDFALSLFSKNLKLGYPPDIVLITTLLNGLIDSRNLNQAVRLLDKTIKLGIQPSPFTYASIIKGHCQSRDFAGAIRLLRNMESTAPFKPDVVIYSTIIDSLCKRQLLPQALGLFEEMKAKSILPNFVTYNIIVRLLCSLRRWNDVNELLTEMLDSGIAPVSIFDQLYTLRPRPSIHVFNQLFNAMFKIKSIPPLSTVVTLSYRLELSGLRPNSHSIGILAKCYCSLGRLDFAFSLLGKNLKLGYPTNVGIIISTLLNGLTDSHNLDQAVQLLIKTVKLGIQLDLVTYNSFLNVYCLCGEMEGAEKLLDIMVKDAVMPNVVTFSSLINGYCKSKKVDKALEMLHDMHLKGTHITPDVFTYSTIIDALFKDERLQLALQLFKDMQDRGVSPNVFTYNTLLNGLLRNARIDAAISLLKEMENNGVAPDIVTYSILINGLCEAGRLVEATKVFSFLVAKGLRPSVTTYTIMVKVLCRQGLLGDATKLLKEMADNGCPPNGRTYNTIIKGFINANEIAVALDHLRIMRSLRFAVDDNTASLFLRLLTAGDVSDKHKALLQKYFLEYDGEKRG